MKRVTFLAFLAMTCGSSAAQTDPPEAIGWGGGFSGGLVLVGGPILVEVRAVDATRDIVLDTKFLLFDPARAEDSAIGMYDAGVLEHESHAQMRLQLREDERFFVEWLRDRQQHREKGLEASSPVAAVTITVRDAGIVALEDSPLAGQP